MNEKNIKSNYSCFVFFKFSKHSYAILHFKDEVSFIFDIYNFKSKKYICTLNVNEHNKTISIFYFRKQTFPINCQNLYPSHILQEGKGEIILKSNKCNIYGKIKKKYVHFFRK